MSEIKDIQKIIGHLTKSPGIYKMLDKEGKVIYIGKANNIQKRVKQYFKKGYSHSSRTQKLVEKIADIKAISTDTELEAIILETNLIKQFQPKYNILMKDDKNYVYIKITQEDFPRIQIVRKIEKDGAKYIGPKTAAHKVKETFKVIKKLFPFRHCGLDIEMIQENPEGKDDNVKVTNKVLKYPCIDYYIKRCIGPCIGKCSVNKYREIVNNAEKFLEGKADNVLKSLYEEMKQLAKDQKFEKAAKLRDKIKKVEDILERQKVSDPNQEDKDIINYCITHNKAFFNLFQIRDGKLIGQENFILNAQEIEESESKEALEAFIKQYYLIATDIPKEILISHELENKKETEKFISEQRQGKAKIIIPKIGDKNKLLEMSLNNARIFADRNKASWQEESEFTKKAVEELQKLLKIPEPLKRIECYDISHLSGTDTVGSMIVFEKGVPKNKFYRKFKIRTVRAKPDDYKSMEEVLKRRFLKIAQAIAHKDFSFKKARIKDFEFIKSKNKIDPDKTDRTLYILEKDKEIKGFIEYKEFSKTRA
ncbi:MAG: excinuclease ABC subunit UvrC [bacterium]|nr:excinuclease ABC subunit UvrC [bacterium]